VLLLFSLSAQSQAGQFNPRDFSGIWLKQGGNNAFGPNRPALTARGMEILNPRIPSRSDARVRVNNPTESNYPTYECNPDGFPNLLLDSEPFEIIMTNDRMFQIFQWEHRIRYIWLDGRQVPSGENLENLGPAWYGHSVGRWDGNTLIVTTVGLDDRAWLDRSGNPKSFHARIEERYRMVDADTIEVQLTLTDPENYTAPWVSDTKRITREPPESYTFFGWKGLFSGITEGICAPMNEVEGYNKRFRDYSISGQPE
jgi:hypothetical protein